MALRKKADSALLDFTVLCVSVGKALMQHTVFNGTDVVSVFSVSTGS